MIPEDLSPEMQESIDSYMAIRERLLHRIDLGLRRKKLSLRTLLVYAKMLSRLQLCDARINAGTEIIVVNISFGSI